MSFLTIVASHCATLKRIVRPWYVGRPMLVLSILLTLNVAEAYAQPPEVKLSTTLGEIVLELDIESAPETVDNFLQYVDSGFYNGTLFHRVIEGFMIQGGGFDEGYRRKSTRAPINNEAYNGLRNLRYTIAMARTTAPHSATSQFFINTVDNHNLDHSGTTKRGWGYTVFGRVVSGHEVVDAISQVRTGPGGPFSRDVPREAVVILEARRVVDLEPTVAEQGQTVTTSTVEKALPLVGRELDSNTSGSAIIEQN